jgi:hypothetical protein
MSLGDFDTSAVIYFKFTTFRPSTGAPFTLAGTPALSVYKDASTTQTTTGVTLTADFDSVTGLNHVAIDTSDAFYAAGSFFDVVITTGTVDGVSAVGTVVGRFTLRKTACLKPTTAGRSLDVSSGGEAGIDWANVGGPTTTLNLSGTTIKAVTDRVSANTDQWNGVTVTGMPLPTSSYTSPPTAATIADAVWDEASGDHLAAGSTGAALNAAGSAGDPWTTTLPGAYTGSQAGKMLADILVDTGTTLQGELDGIQADTEDIQSRLPTALVSGRIDASVGAMQPNVLTASALATDAVSEIQSGLATTANVAAIETDTQDIQSRLPAALVSGRIDASVGAMASGVFTAAALATDAVGEIADGVWDEPYSGHTTAGSFGKLVDTLRKANYVTEGAVAAGGTPTTTVFRTNLTEPTGTFDNQTLLFISGDLSGESAAIEAYSVTNGQITLGDALTQAPTAADEFVILPDHVHPIGEIADGVLTRQMTEAYRAAGVAPTLAQVAFELMAHMGDSAISGTTKTLKKLDGTTAKTFTLDSATTPTSITEAT